MISMNGYVKQNESEILTLGDHGITLRCSERRPYTIIHYTQVQN